MTAGVARLLAMIGLTALTACASHPAKRSASGTTPTPANAAPAGRYAQDRDSGPQGPPPDLSKIPEPVPKPEKPSQYGNKTPYNVLGETYRVLPSPHGYVERGIASWYGNKFHGHMTSTFEPYDMYAYSAAHKTLPLPCYARVTNLENGASVIVRVNDRGPFAENRIIDLSYVAAVKLGIWQKGTGLVEVRALDSADDHRAAEPRHIAEASIKPASAAATPQKTPKPGLYLQVGAFSDQANAEHAADQVRAAHLGEVQVVNAQVNGKMIHRVRLGPLKDADDADRLTPSLRKLGLGTPHVAVDD